MAYTAWKQQRLEELREKQKAYDCLNVLEAFPSYKQTLKLKKEFSVRLMSKTYKWLIEVQEAYRANEGLDAQALLRHASQGCDMFIKDGMEVDTPHTLRNVAVNEEDNCFAEEVDEEEEEEEEEVEELNEAEMVNFKRMLGGGQEAGLGNIGAMLGGMMQNVLGSVMSKDGPMYKMHKAKYEALQKYLEDNSDSLSPDAKDDLERMLTILKAIVQSYDDFGNDFLALNNSFHELSREMKSIKTPYPAEIKVEDAAYMQEFMTSVGGGGAQQQCAIM